MAYQSTPTTAKSFRPRFAAPNLMAGNVVMVKHASSVPQCALAFERLLPGGARVLVGGKRIAGQAGAFMQPTILTDISQSNPAYREEFFGPVALFFRVPDEDAAVALANDSPFGLGGSVFTQDIERGKRLGRRIDAGMAFINSAASSSPELPFGGMKNSGYGRELSGAGTQEFVNKKLIRVN